MNINRREAISCIAGGLLAARTPAFLHAQDSGEATAATVCGKVRGARDHGVSIFKGIPYGGFVSGAHRFRPPTPPEPWKGTRDALMFGPPSLQGPPHVAREPEASEDCLFLNVWTPAADTKRRPVMFYSHGGGFSTGSGAHLKQDGANLARFYDVVVVETNHRLGILGYLFLKEILGPEYPGNQGLLDLVLALQWVQQNIDSFGGDPHNVMIFGESGGGGKTTCLYGMPMAKGLFHRASIESSANPSADPNAGPIKFYPADATEAALAVLKRLNIPKADARKLLQVPAASLLDAQMHSAVPGRMSSFGPLIDGVILPELPFDRHAPGCSATVPLIVGTCSDETMAMNLGNPKTLQMDRAELIARLTPQLKENAAGFIHTWEAALPNASPGQVYVAITTNRQFRAHAVHVAELKFEQQTAPVFAYILGYQSTAKVPGTGLSIGSPHASDIAAKFDNFGPDPASSGPWGLAESDVSDGRKQVEQNMSEMWATFARTGHPGAKGQAYWPPYDLTRRSTMWIDATCKVIDDPEHTQRLFWESVDHNAPRL